MSLFTIMFSSKTLQFDVSFPEVIEFALQPQDATTSGRETLKCPFISDALVQYRVGSGWLTIS
jgi:hypothetical protein